MGGETSRVQRLVDQEFEGVKSKATPSSIEMVRPDRFHIAAVRMSHLVRQNLVLNQIESLQGVKFPTSVTRINLVRPFRTLLAHFQVFERFHSADSFYSLQSLPHCQYRLYPCSIVDLRPCYRAEILSQASTAPFSQLV
jgi:hypothetical protein